MEVSYEVRIGSKEGKRSWGKGFRNEFICSFFVLKVLDWYRFYGFEVGLMFRRGVMFLCVY